MDQPHHPETGLESAPLSDPRAAEAEFAPRVEELEGPSPRREDLAAKEFAAALQAASPRVAITYLLAITCLVVYGLMVLRGVSPISPTAEDGYAWGGSSGPAVVLEGEAWRLVTSQFVHFGLVHLAFNMWCLVGIGPMVERLYGRWYFLALYLLSGIGGALAALGHQPMMVEAGASASIFGLIGALGSFLLVRRRDVPLAVLQKLRSSVFAFVAYNLLFGLMNPWIATDAHLGGLVTGFLTGLMLQRPWPLGASESPRGRRIAGVLAASGLVMLAGFVVAGSVDRNAEVRKLADSQAALVRYRSFMEAANPALRTIDDLAQRFQDLTAEFDRGLPEAQVVARIRELKAEGEANLEHLKALQPGDAELEAMRGDLVEWQGRFLSLLDLLANLRRATPLEPQAAIAAFRDGCDQTRGSLDRFKKDVDDYARAHELTLSPAKQNTSPP